MSSNFEELMPLFHNILLLKQIFILMYYKIHKCSVKLSNNHCYIDRNARFISFSLLIFLSEGIIKKIMYILLGIPINLTITIIHVYIEYNGAYIHIFK